MTPRELNIMALKAAEQEYRTAVDKLTKAAAYGLADCRFKSLMGTTMVRLENEGYAVNYDRPAIRFNKPAIVITRATQN